MSDNNNNNWDNEKFKRFLAYGAVGAGLLFIYNMTSGADGQANRPSPFGSAYSTVFDRASKGEVGRVVVEGKKLHGYYTDGGRFALTMPEGHADPVGALIKLGVTVDTKEEAGPGIGSVLISWAPMLLLIGVWIYFMKNMQRGGGGIGGFGKSKAKLRDQSQGRVTFDDVAGIEEAKEDLLEIVEFLRDPGKYQRMGGQIPKGALLVGPPGTGKTLIARAVAGEANVPFFTISGSDFVEMFVGVGASRVRDMFAEAKKNSPCIIFIDEIDAVGGKRGNGIGGGGNDEREQTLNQLLVEMDGFEKTDSVIILAATNRPDMLDPALLRPGRFDRRVDVQNPDVGGREKILKVHMRKSPISPDVDVKTIARGTSGFSGADLANLVNEAALLAAKRNKRLVTMVEYEDAREKIIMGAEKKSSVVSPQIKKLVAYHEAGHVIPVLHLKDESEPVHKVTIIGRRGAGGYMARLPNENEPMDEIKMKANMVIAAGGRIAEEIILNRRSIGASADIAMVTDMARAMVTQYGFSDKVGFVRHGGGQREVLGQMIGQAAEIAPETQKMVDDEIKRLSDEAYAACKKILEENKAQLINVAEALLEFESLTGDEAAAAALAAPGKGKDAVADLRASKIVSSSILSGVYSSVPKSGGPSNDNLG